jgi:hypothetical protein
MIPSTSDRRRPVLAFAIGALFACAVTARGQTPPPPSPSATPGASITAPPATGPSPVVPAPPSLPPSASPGATIAPPAPNRPADEEFALGGLPSTESGANAVAPYMIGDFFAGYGQIFLFSKDSANPGRQFIGQIPSAGGSGRAKITDDNSVLPEDRVFFLYDHFDNAILIPVPSPHALDVNRYTPGFEKTFFDRYASFELRIPFADTQNSDVFLGGDGREEATEFGNLEAVLKMLVWRDDAVAFGGGIGFNLPTAPGARIFEAEQSQPLFTIDNNAFHVQPFLGLLYTPSDRLFFQAFLQFDIDATGNHVEQRDVGRVGTLYDQNLLQTDLQLGYWWFRDPSAHFLTGLAPTIEYHYTTTLQNAKLLAAGTPDSTFVFGNAANRLDIQNLTLGVEMLIGRRALLNVAAVVPLNGNNANRQFDSEIFVEFNRFF